jgi:hypothetical protein
MKSFILCAVATLLSTGCGQVVSSSAEAGSTARPPRVSVEPSAPVDTLAEGDPTCSFAFDGIPAGPQSVFSGKHSDLSWSSGQTVLGLTCTYDDPSSGTVGYVNLDLYDVTGSGHYAAGVSAGINAGPWDGDKEVQFEGGDCSVNLQTTAETTGAMSATFECKSLVQLRSNGYWRQTNHTLRGSMRLPPVPPRVAPAKPSCSMALDGTYETRAGGTGEVYGPSAMSCDSVGADGARYVLRADLSNYASGIYTLVAFHGWSATEFRGPCTVTSATSDGNGGPVVADLTCDAMVAADGSLESIRGHVEGIIPPPPK